MSRPPSADQGPPSPDSIIVFDGDCAFCSGGVRLLLALDRKGVFRFTPVRSPYGRVLAAGAGVDPEDPSTFLFFDRGDTVQATDAIAAVLARLPAPWSWLRMLRIVPRPLRDAAYRWVARNRYRIAGRREACLLPLPDQRSRFIEAVPAEES